MQSIWAHLQSFQDNERKKYKAKDLTKAQRAHPDYPMPQQLEATWEAQEAGADREDQHADRIRQAEAAADENRRLGAQRAEAHRLLQVDIADAAASRTQRRGRRAQRSRSRQRGAR